MTTFLQTSTTSTSLLVQLPGCVSSLTRIWTNSTPRILSKLVKYPPPDPFNQVPYPALGERQLGCSVPEDCMSSSITLILSRQNRRLVEQSNFLIFRVLLLSNTHFQHVRLGE